MGAAVTPRAYPPPMRAATRPLDQPLRWIDERDRDVPVAEFDVTAMLNLHVIAVHPRAVHLQEEDEQHVRVPAHVTDELKTIEGDLVVVGEPGIGKTFLLQQLMEDDWGLFDDGWDISQLEDTIRDMQPTRIVVDDAHLQGESVEQAPATADPDRLPHGERAR